MTNSFSSTFPPLVSKVIKETFQTSFPCVARIKWHLMNARPRWLQDLILDPEFYCRNAICFNFFLINFVFN